MWQALISPLTGLAKTWMEGRQRKKELKQIRHNKKVEAVQKMDVAQAEREMHRVKSLLDSWKDEFVTVVIVMPAILAFCGDWGAAVVTAGFKALSTTPEWYQYLLVAVVSVAAGIPLGGKATQKFKEFRKG